jgi:hypothetical protein
MTVEVLSSSPREVKVGNYVISFNIYITIEFINVDQDIISWILILMI